MGFFYTVPIISFTGKMGVGKSTAIKYLENKFPFTKIIKFADPLYDIQRYVYERSGLILNSPKDRKLLQFIGTDWGRSINDNIWVELYEKSVKTSRYESMICPLVLTDDVRFDNEAIKIKELGGIVIKIEKEIINDAILCGGSSNHKSELGISDNYIDFTIKNNNSIYELEQKLNEIIDNNFKLMYNLKEN